MRPRISPGVSGGRVLTWGCPGPQYSSIKVSGVTPLSVDKEVLRTDPGSWCLEDLSLLWVCSSQQILGEAIIDGGGGIPQT